MDGTIIDTEHIWKKATRMIMTKRGIAIDQALEEELEQRLAGMALPQSCKILKEVVNLPDDVENLVQEKSNNACELYEKQVNFINGFEEFHLKLQKHGLKTGLATNADDNTLNLTNRKLNLHRFFGEHLYNVSHVNHQAKPHPALYLHAAHKLEVDLKTCIAIEDSAHGIQAAQAAGLFCIGLNSSGNLNQVKNADLIVDEYHEINLEKLLGLGGF